MRARFPGFSPEAISFFRLLAKNNRRDWFQPRKETFDREVMAPMIALVTALSVEMERFAKPYVPADPKKAIYRLYRDTRFSEDKTPYKDHLGARFVRRGLEKYADGGLYVSVSHKEVEIAGGVYMPSSPELLAIRSHLAEKHGEFERILANRTLRRLMGELQGESLSRVPKGFSADHPAADLLKRKQWLLYITREAPVATTPRLIAEVVKRFEAMMPFVEFLNAPLVAGARKSETAFRV